MYVSFLRRVRVCIIPAKGKVQANLILERFEKDKCISDNEKYTSSLTEAAKSPISFLSIGAEGWPSGQRQQTVNLPTYVYAGSNPAPSTRLFSSVFLTRRPLSKTS